MRMRLQVKGGIRGLALCGMLTALAMIFSYIESLFTAFFPIPFPIGVKLGLANTVVTLAFFLLTPTRAFMISVCRVLMSALLFGNITSLAYSALGAFFAFGGLLISRRLGKRISFIGVSVISAVLHSLGQITAAVMFFGTAPIYYLPVLTTLSAFFGAVTGVLMNLISQRFLKEING